METVAVAGAGGRLGREVVRRLQARLGPEAVVPLDDGGGDGPRIPPGVTTLVHLPRQSCPQPEPEDGGAAALARLVAAAEGTEIDSVVVVSSAAAYGARPDNPVPLTEEAPLRPNEGGTYAGAKAEVERRWAAWADGRPGGASVAVLRPALVVGDDEEQWLPVALRAATRWGVGEPDAPTQFLHVDDLAAAVDLAVELRLDDVYNVAPEGWLHSGEVQAITGTPMRPPVPPGLAQALARWCWSRKLGGVAPELVPLVTHPWVVASDRLRGIGWQPAHSNAETLVEAFPATPWARLASRWRRTLALAGAGAVTVAVPAALARAMRRRRSR